VRALIPALALGLVTLAAVAADRLQPAERGAVAVVFPPSVDETAAWERVLASGGLIVGSTQLPNVVVAFAPDAGFEGRVRARGALLFMKASGLCTTPPATATPKPAAA
jgi:hypothetical protein